MLLDQNRSRCLLVDTGWNTEEAYQAWYRVLKRPALFEDLRIIFITHTTRIITVWPALQRETHAKSFE